MKISNLKEQMKEGKQKLIQDWFDGETSYQELQLMEQEAIKEESYELAQVMKSAIDWIDNLEPEDIIN